MDMHLILIRHADTKLGQAARPDLQRQLSRSGVAQVERLVAWLSRRGQDMPRPWRLLASPAQRALQTAAPLAELLALDTVLAELLYEASLGDLQALLAENKGSGSLILVAHNPALSGLASELLRRPYSLAPANAVHLNVSQNPAQKLAEFRI